MSGALLTVLVVAGCGWKSDGLARLDELYPPPAPIDAGTSTGTVDLGTPLCNGYAGTWAVRLVQHGSVAPLGAPWDLVITDLFLAEGSPQALSLRPCDQLVAIATESGPTNLGRTAVPEALKSALGARPVTVPLPTDGSFAANDVVWLWGLGGLAMPLTDALPTMDNFMGDSRVVDQDQDGHPGVTLNILVPAGDRYMVRRAIWQLGPGKLTLNNQWLTGPLVWSVNESALGATNSLLLTAAPLSSKTDGSHYQLRCVGKTYTCAALSRDHLKVFEDAPR